MYGFTTIGCAHTLTLARGIVAGLLVVGAACRRGGDGGGDQPPAEGSGTTGESAATSAFSPPDDCMSSEDCETSGHCIAPYDPAPPDGNPERGPAACVDACIGENDLQRWCLDHAGCCEGLRCNGVDGFCERAGALDGSTTEAASTETSATESTTSTGPDSTSTGTTTGATDGSSTTDTSSSSG